MPANKILTKLIPRIYKYNYENLGLFFFVKGQLKILPTMSLEHAINNYFKFIDASPDDWDILSARTMYNRMQTDFYQCGKNETAKET
jgi:hypothetical protein